MALCLAAFACFSAQAGDDGAPYLPDIKSENGMNWLAADEMRYLCAGNSIYVAAKLSGTDADFSEIFKRLYTKKSVGISIGEIEDELERLGIAHKTIRLSWAQIFANKGGLFIVYTPPPEGMDLGIFTSRGFWTAASRLSTRRRRLPTSRRTRLPRASACP